MWVTITTVDGQTITLNKFNIKSFREFNPSNLMGFLSSGGDPNDKFTEVKLNDEKETTYYVRKAYEDFRDELEYA